MCDETRHHINEKKNSESYTCKKEIGSAEWIYAFSAAMLLRVCELLICESFRERVLLQWCNLISGASKVLSLEMRRCYISLSLSALPPRVVWVCILMCSSTALILFLYTCEASLVRVRSEVHWGLSNFFFHFFSKGNFFLYIFLPRSCGVSSTKRLGEFFRCFFSFVHKRIIFPYSRERIHTF